MADLPKPIQNILDQFGLSQESVQKFKFGGIVGKVTLVALGGFAAAIGVAKYTNGSAQVLCVLSFLGTTILLIRWILNYAEKHPASATLEGLEVVIWQQQQMMLAAKGIGSVPESPVIPNPEGSAPQLDPPAGGNE